MSIGEDFAASLNGTAQPSEVQKARQARVLYLGGLTLAKLEQEEEAERTAGTLSEPTANLFRAIKTEKAAAEVESLKSLGQPEVILTEYVRGLRDGRFTEKFQPVVEQLWTDTYKTLAQRSAMEKGVAAGGALATAAVEAVPMMVRGLVEAGKAVTSLSPEDTARSAAAAELGGAQSMRLLRGIGRIGDEDTTAEGLKKIFERDLKELSDIEGTRRYEGKFLREMAAKAPGLKAAVEDIKLNLTEEDLKRVDDLSNIFDPTELIPIGFVVGKFGKLFGVAAKTEKGRKVMARTFKTAAEAAEEAEALNGVLNKVRKSVGSAMERQGNRIASTTGGAPVSVFLGGLASGLDAGTSFVAAAVASNIPKPLRQAVGSAVAATGRTLAKDLPAPLERARLGFNAAAKELSVGAAEGMAGNAIFALGAETPEQAGGLLGTGAGLGGGIVAAGQAFDKGRGLMNVTENRFSPADRKVESTRQPASSYNEGLDDIHNAAVGKLDNSSANAIEEMRRTIVGPKGRLYVVDTPEQAAKIASFYTGNPVDAKEVASNGFSLRPELTEQGVGVAVVYSKGEAFGHEPGHLLVESFKASDNPEHVKLISDIYQQARQSLPENSARFRDLQAYYNSLLPAGAKPLDVQGVYNEFIAEHFTTVVGGAPAIKFGGDMPLSKKIYDAALTLGEQIGAYQPGLDLTGRSPVSSKTLPFKPSPQLAKLVENMLAARQLELSKAVPSDLAQPPVLEQPAAPAAGVQNVEVVTPPAQPPGFKKGDPIGNISDPKGTLVFTGAKVWDDKQGPTVRIEGVDTNGNIVRADVPREWLQSPAATPTPTPAVDVGASVPVPPDLVGLPTSTPAPTPAPAPAPAPAVPNVRVTPGQQDTFTAPTAEQIEKNRAKLEAAAGQPRAKTPFFETEYFSAKADEFAPDAVTRREQRRLADALEAKFPDYENPLRTVFQKIFAPFKYLGGDNPRVFGFSFDKLIQNVDVLAGWQAEHPEVALPYKPGDALIRQDLQTYLRNQANGYGGGGNRLTRPSDTREGTITPENPDYTPVQLSREKVEYLNLLMGFEPPQKTTPAAEYFRRFAEQNGLSTGYTPTGSPDTNNTRVRLRKAGFNSRLLNSVVENLPIRRIMGDLKERPDIDLQAGDTGITQAGFMPEKKDTRVINIGLNVQNGTPLTEQNVLDALRAEGLEPVRYETGQSTTEPTLVAEIPAADNAVITRLSEKLGQDAIAVYNPATDTGVLLGPRAAAWGEFNKDFFLPLSDEKPALMPYKTVTADEALALKRDVAGWVLPDGKMIFGRNQFVHEDLAKSAGYASIEALRAAGGQRVVLDSSTETDRSGEIILGVDRWSEMPEPQAKAVRRLAQDYDLNVRLDTGRSMQFMPSKKEGSMGKKKLRFVNYSNNPDKKTLDPQFFGKSGVTPASELSGKPRAYAYLKGSPLGQDKGLIDTRKFVHEGEVDGSKIYDGVADVLDYGLIRNKEQADQMLVNRGFTGIYREGQDGRQQIEFFEPVELTKSKENKPLVEDDVEAVSSLAPLVQEEIDYQAMDAEFARKRDAGEPLFMPAKPRADAERWVDVAALRIGRKTFTGDSHWAAYETAREQDIGPDDISDLTDDAFGFLDNKRKWLSREEAYQLAEEAGQFTPDPEEAGFLGSETLARPRLEAESFFESGPEDYSARQPSFMPAPPVDSEAFKAWFGDSKVLDSDDRPLVVFHGTVSDFTKFDRQKANPEGDFGAGFYFTNTAGDVAENYAGEGPDLQNRLEQRAERMEYDFPELSYKERLEKARQEVKRHEGATMAAFLRMENPFVLGTDGNLRETYLEGRRLINFVERLARSVDERDAGKVREEIYTEIDPDGASAKDLIEAAKKSETLSYAEDNEGKLISPELIRRAIEGAGFDGIVDFTVDEKFGSQKRLGKPMAGMTPETVHYIAFKPTQIKSATGNAGTYSRRNPDIRFMPKARGITSQLEATLQAIPEKASRQQIEAALRDGVKEKGQMVARPVRAEEMRDIVDQTGRSFEDFLKENPTASKAELLDFVRQNQIEVMESRLGRFGKAAEHTPDEWARMSEDWEEAAKRAQERGEFATADQFFTRAEEASRYAEGRDDLGSMEGTPKYGRYVLPGGERYREIIYTTPEQAPRFTVDDLKHSTVAMSPREQALYWVIEGPDNTYIIPKREHKTLEAAKAYVVRTKQPHSTGYVSSHFEGTPNYLAHARVNERVVPFDQSRIDAIGQKLVDGMKVKSANSLGSGAPEVGVARGYITEAEAIAFSKAKGFRNIYHDSIRPEGETMLFAEELQSDLHQSGRKKGYRGDESPVEAAEIERLRGKLIELDRRLTDVDEALKKDPENALLESRKTAIQDGYRAVLVRRDDLLKALDAEKVPDAPFKKSWHEFVFKNLLRDAAEQGKDWLGWTTGDQQAERYDLSKQVERVTYGGGFLRVDTKAERGGTRDFINEEVAPEKIADYIGKDAAQKLLDSPKEQIGKQGDEPIYRQTLQGLDLKVGGEGMRGFYDEILPRFVDKYLKRYGVKTQSVKVPANLDSKTWQKFAAGDQPLVVDDLTSVHAVRITPELRKDILEKGQPAYMPEKPDVLADPKYKKLRKNLTPDELESENRRLAQGMVEVFDELPSETELEEAAKMGLIKRGWYSRAATALRHVFGPDTPQFVAVLAATSPQQPVIKNLEMSLQVWDAWQKAGRPTDAAVLKAMVGPLVDIDSRTQNTVRALQGFPDAPQRALDAKAKLSGFKVESFGRNLLDDELAVTLDTWMAQFAGLDAVKMRGSRARYLAYASRVRAAAKKTGLTPAEVQETVWSFFKTLTEMSVGGQTTKDTLRILSERDLVDTPEFYENLTRDPAIRALLEGLGFTDFAGLVDTEYETRRANASDQPLLGAEVDRRSRILDRVTRRAALAAEAIDKSTPEAPLEGEDPF